MTETAADLVGIGNAIVDILGYKDKSFLDSHGFVRGSMKLIEQDEAARLTKEMGSATECSGGSTANTLAGYAMLGGKAAFIGKVHDDQLGIIFRKDLQRTGVHFPTPAAKVGDPTARCLIMVTEESNPYGGPPKVERTMATYLGTAARIERVDIDEALIAQAKVLFFEGYLWDSPIARESIRYAITLAKKHNVKVSFTLSDAFCVKRHHPDFLKLVQNDIDILFCNEHEAEALFGESDLHRQLHLAGEVCETVAITRSERGSYIIQNGDIHAIEPEKVETVFDVTGAGDLYASGFLYGYINGYSAPECGKLASLCAAEVIQYLGARPVTKLPELLKKLG